MPPASRSLTSRLLLITPPTLRLDLDTDRNNLADTVARLQPRLLILDPFVRLHRRRERQRRGRPAARLSARTPASIWRRCARKGAGNARAGQALRGSSEFHAWGDSNLYLRRDGNDLTLTVEHRAAAR
jgi:hypothetical protein